MAYASVEDMIARFGEPEMARATAPANTEIVGVNPEPISTALEDASALIDSYLRRRYAVPLQAVPPEINRACCMLARYDLGLGGQRSISDQAQKTREEIVGWLGRIARGDVLLGMEEVSPGEESFATAQGRRPVFGESDYCSRAGYGFWSDEL